MNDLCKHSTLNFFVKGSFHDAATEPLWSQALNLKGKKPDEHTLRLIICVSSAITQLFHGFEHKFYACNNTNSTTSFHRHALSTSLCSLSPLKHVACKNSPLWSEMHSDLMKKTYILNVFFQYNKTYALIININLNQCVIRGFGVYHSFLHSEFDVIGNFWQN